MEEDLKTMEVRNWRGNAESIEEWSRIVESKENDEEASPMSTFGIPFSFLPVIMIWFILLTDLLIHRTVRENPRVKDQKIRLASVEENLKTTGVLE